MHVVNLMSIAYADGTITEEENNLLVRIAQSLDLTEEEFNQCVEYWKQTDEADLPFADPVDEDEQIEYLKHFTMMMMVDGEMDDREKEYVVTVADRFGFNGEEVVPSLIEMVYQEYFADAEDGDEEEAEEDPLFEDTCDESQIEIGKIELEGKQVGRAFDELFLPSLRTPEAFDYFHIIPGIDTRLFLLTDEQIDKVKEAADKGYAVAQYVLGRYHQVRKPEENSLEQAEQLLKAAANAGVPDAWWALAIHYLYGYQGPVVMEHFNELIDEAFEKNSPMALKQRLHDVIHGEHGQKADPKGTIAHVNDFLEKDEDFPAKYPYLYDLMGDAYHKVGNKDQADECYEKAVNLGYFEADAHRFENRVEGPDKDFYRNTFSFILDFACDNDSPRCFLLRALEHAYHYETEDPSKHEATGRQLREDLEHAYHLGVGDAAYYLGLYHYEGSHGFEKNPGEAWAWFGKGQDLESAKAYTGMAQMVLDGVKPSTLPDNFLEYLLLCAVRRGDFSMLPTLLESYKAGKLKGLEEEVEKTYLPMLTQPASQSGLPAVVVVAPDGKATIYKVEKAEWDKMPTLIGAKRLAPISVEGFEKLGQNLGLTDHLVAWVDIDAPRKGLPLNPIASNLYQGDIAGDVVFSLADRLYEEMPFYGVDEAKTIVKALGAKLGEVVTDLRSVSPASRTHADYSKVNPLVDMGYVARIQPDGTAHLIHSSRNVFALFEEDLYDPQRLQHLRDLSVQLNLKGRLTLWTDHSALRKHNVMADMAPLNPIGTALFPGPVADNFFVALEDEHYRILLFDDVASLRQTCLALGVKEENIIIESD